MPRLSRSSSLPAAPAGDGSPFEAMVAAGGVVTPKEEFGGGRVSPPEEFMDAQFAEGRRLMAERRTEMEQLEKAQRVLEGRHK